MPQLNGAWTERVICVSSVVAVLIVFLSLFLDTETARGFSDLGFAVLIANLIFLTIIRPRG